ncbi:MAG: hypothetical protein A2744_04075 [Candidatus Buchananbacteria bacterium RIFCSPHIGHO2_01_FULL_44_11]|uniref:PDZ domain-containing protein n=1 Tax=Candidatus Buchananbacteria bacterium RIFCSPHIGHO2_01_FULL_44_11 TaxID=1797535 RepID=A0A1G1Y132_9BACT|nr:MAG: hypothetical protein A2744_04075 [Candidatus Buchananbacteria bacterium RIFCSPHIGHO2_01_FULL_44_11]
MKFFKNGKNKISNANRFISQVVVLAVIFGFFAGVVGQIFADVYINPWPESLIQSPGDNQDNPLNLPELRRVKRFLGIEQDFEVEKSIAQALPAMVGVYLKKAPGDNDPLSQIYLPKDLLGNGFILTSDGWILTHQFVVQDLAQDKFVVVYKNEKFAIDQVVIDSMSGIAFLKISANNLPVVVLGDSDEITLGQLAVTINFLGEVVVTNIKDSFYQPKNSANDFVLSTEQYSQAVLLENDISDLYLGSPLLNLAGEVTGVINQIDLSQGVVTAVPINQFRPITLGVLKNHFVKRPYLGLVYLDLSKISDSSQPQGALIYKKPLSNTPAADAGLAVGDIIVSVDGQPVDSNDNLTKLIQQYQPGDQVNLDIIRDGKQLAKIVTLSLMPE